MSGASVSLLGSPEGLGMNFAARRVRCVIYGIGGSHDLAWVNTRWSSEPPPKGFIVSGVRVVVVCWWCVAAFEDMYASPGLRRVTLGTSARPAMAGQRVRRFKIQLLVGVLVSRRSRATPYLTGT
jgi:hypothetical protein